MSDWTLKISLLISGDALASTITSDELGAAGLGFARVTASSNDWVLENPPATRSLGDQLGDLLRRLESSGFFIATAEKNVSLRFSVDIALVCTMYRDSTSASGASVALTPVPQLQMPDSLVRRLAELDAAVEFLITVEAGRLISDEE